MPFEGAVGSDVDINIAALFASVWRAKRWLVPLAFIVCALAYVAASLMTPKYRGETRVIIETQESIFTRADAAPGADAPLLSPEGVKSQVELMSSTDLLKRVAAKLDLAAHKEFDPADHISSVSRLLIRLGLENDPSLMPKDERVVDGMRSNLDIYNVASSRVIVIQFSSHDRKLAAAVPNAIADEYISLQEAAKRESNSQATNWLGPEVADMSKRVKDAEAKVAKYRAATGLLIGQNNVVLPTQQLAEITSELSRVQANRAASEAKASAVSDALKNGADLDTLPDVVASPLIQRLREQKVALKSQIADLSTTLLPGHPRIRALKSQLADLDTQIRQEARKVLQSLENAADIARRREADLTHDLNQLKAQAGQAGEQQVELDALQRDADAQRQLLQSYMTRYREAASRENHHYLPADARVFSRALVPGDPYFPKKIPIVAVAFVATILLGSIFVLLRELFSGRALVAAGAPFVEHEELRMPVREVADEEGEGIDVPPADVPAVALAPVSTRGGRRPEPDEAPGIAGPDYSLLEGSVIPGPEVGRPAAVDGDDGSAPGVSQQVDAPAEEPPDAGHADFTVTAVARRLIRTHATLAFTVSPEGDEGSAASVLLVRELADRGLRSILVDLTGTGVISDLMVEGERVPGITDLLASERQFTEVIHADRYSEAHVVPSGLADQAKAMKAIDRLPIIVNALQTAYDVVVVECGAADLNGLSRLASRDAEILISVVDPDNSRIAETATELKDAGYCDLAFMTSFGSLPEPEPENGKGVELRTAAHS